MHKERIRECDAVIHVVGQRYGTEPDPASLPAVATRRSYTQMEADIARRLGRKLFVFLFLPGRRMAWALRFQVKANGRAARRAYGS